MLQLAGGEGNVCGGAPVAGVGASGAAGEGLEEELGEESQLGLGIEAVGFRQGVSSGTHAQLATLHANPAA